MHGESHDRGISLIAAVVMFTLEMNFLGADVMILKVFAPKK
jgi:hypothetical protein